MRQVYEHYGARNLTFKQCRDCDHGWENDYGNQFQIGFKTLYEERGYITNWEPACDEDEIEDYGTLQEFSQKEFVQTGWAAESVNDNGDPWTWK